MKIIIAKNNTGQDIKFSGLDGIIIPASGQTNVHEVIDPYKLSLSDIFLNNVLSGTLTINDGTSDLSPEEGIGYLGYAYANHTHSGIDNIPNSFIDLDDTPTTYSGVDNYYLKVSASGVVFVRESSFIASQSAVTSDYNVLTDQTITYIDASNNDIYIYMVNPSTSAGKIMWFKRIDSTSSNKVYIKSDETYTIEGDYDVKLRCRDSYTISSDGTNYWII